MNGRRSRATIALLVLGGWLVVSPLVLAAARVTAGMVSAVGSGVALVVLAGGALLAARRQARSAATSGGEQLPRLDGDHERR